MLAVLALALALEAGNEGGVPSATAAGASPEAQQILADAQRQFEAKLQELGLSGAAPLVGAERLSRVRIGESRDSSGIISKDVEGSDAHRAPREIVNH